MRGTREIYHLDGAVGEDVTDRRSLSDGLTPVAVTPTGGRHAREPGPATTLLPLVPHEGEYGVRVRVDGRYVALILPDGRRPVFLTVHKADALASAILKAAREATAAEVA